MKSKFRRFRKSGASFLKKFWTVFRRFLLHRLRSFGRIGAVWVSDFRRVSSSVVGGVVIFGLCVLPCLYAWFNIFSNWDPYGTSATSRIRVAVYSEDAGADIMGVSVNIGEKVISGLEANKSIGWQFLDSKEEALEAVYSGDCYAALVIPENFSDNVLSFITLGFEHPQVDYYENQKKNGIAPKITAKASTAVQQQVNATFIETVAGIFGSAFTVAEENGVDFPTVFHNISDECEDISSELENTQKMLRSTVNLLNSTATTLDAGHTLLNNVSVTAGDASQLATDISNELNTIQLASQQILDSIGFLIEDADAQNAPEAKDAAKTALTAVSDAVRISYSAATDVANTTENLSGALVVGTGDTAYSLWNSIKSVNTTATELRSTDEKLSKAREILLDMADTLDAFADSEYLQNLLGAAENNGDEIGTYFATPIQMTTVIMYPIENYGSAMAPFYTVLAQWVGALFSVCLMKATIRKEDVPLKLNVRERYFGRLGIFFLVCTIQAMVTALGDLLYVGIYCLHPGLFILSAFVVGMCFCMINYALLFSLEKIGLGASVIIMVIQVAGSGGSYPIDVVPKVFRIAYPYMPFNYAMNSMREAIAGTYGNNYRNDLLILLLITFIFMVLGQLLYFPAHKLNDIIRESNKKAEIMY